LSIGEGATAIIGDAIEGYEGFSKNGIFLF